MPNTNTLLKEKRREIMEGEKNLTNYTNFLSIPERSDKIEEQPSQDYEL